MADALCSTVIAALLAAMPLAATAAACDWSYPGENKFRGDKLRAVDRYTDIPEAARDQIKAKIKAREPDDIAEIERDTIIGRRGLYSNMRDMYFGAATLCSTVTRPTWPTGLIERAPIYTATYAGIKYSVMIPDICGNVSRVDWAPTNGATQAPIVSRPTAPAVHAVPEPATALLVIPAMIFIALRIRRVSDSQ